MESSSAEKDVGVIIDDKLTFDKHIREHPFNLKGIGGGGYGFFWSQNILFWLRSAAEIFSRRVVATLFFFYKNNIF